MKKRFGLLALSLPAAFAVGGNLDTGIKVSWTATGGCPTGSVIQIKGTSTSGAAARESCGSTSGTLCTTGSQVILCSSGSVTILNWASGNWNLTVNLLASTDSTGASPLATASLTGKTVTEGQITDLGSVTLTSGGGGTTTVAITFTFAGAGNTSCTTADLSGTGGAAVTNPTRGLRYKLTCGTDTTFKNTTDNTAQQTLCATSPTALSATTYTGTAGSCTLEAQLLDDDTASSGTPYPEHCDYYATSSVTVTSGTANAFTIDLQKQTGGGTCPLAKQLW